MISKLQDKKQFTVEVFLFIEVIKDCILYPSRHSEKRKNFISKIYSNVDGKAIERATSCILKFVESKGIKL